MARERSGFIVSQVYAVVHYTDSTGHHHKITKPANTPAADSKKKLNEPQKQALKIKHAKLIVRDTLASLKKQGASDCKGSVEVRIYARVGYTDDQGKRHDIVRAAESRTKAREKIAEIKAELEERGGKTLEASRMTFADLAKHFEKHYLKPAEYVDGPQGPRKVDGVRSLVPAKAAVNALKRYFGSRRLQSITYGDLRAYRAARLKVATPADLARHDRDLVDDKKAELKVTRTIATVNREMSKLKRMLNIAQREGWIKTNPFNQGEPLISMADEQKRERILTSEEERRLLEACPDTGSRKHLRPIIIAALDTGMRRGELLTLRWRDVDLEGGMILIQAFNTKTAKQREIAMTTRLKEELTRLYENSTKEPSGRVFGVVDNVKRSFTAARQAAGLQGVRFHDLRHTAATRLVGLHIPLAEVGRVLGHTQPQTTYRYTNLHAGTARRAATALDAFHAEGEQESAPAPESGVIN